MKMPDKIYAKPTWDTTNPKASVRFGRFNIDRQFEGDTEYTRRALVDELIEKYKILLSASQEYWDYTHDGDPWTEDARAMGEMTLDEIKRQREEFEKALVAIQDKES